MFPTILKEYRRRKNVTQVQVAAAIGSGLISGMGNGSLNPQGQATRAQAAVIYEKLIKQMVKE